MKNEELAAQVSALQIQPGTIVVLRLQHGTPANLARQMGEEVQKRIPFGTQIFVLPSGEDIEALSEEQMRQLGWVRQSSVIEAINELADASTAVSNVAYNLGQKSAEWDGVIQPAIKRLDDARNAARSLIKSAKGAV